MNTCPDCNGTGYQVVGIGALYRCENGCSPPREVPRLGDRPDYPEWQEQVLEVLAARQPNDCECDECRGLDDGGEAEHHADYVAGLGLHGEVGA